MQKPTNTGISRWPRSAKGTVARMFCAVALLTLLIGAPPASAQADGDGYRWRLVRSDARAGAPRQSETSRYRLEETYEASETELAGHFRTWIGGEADKDVQWQVRFRPPPEYLSADQPLDMSFDGSLVSRGAGFAEAWTFNAHVIDAQTGGRYTGPSRQLRGEQTRRSWEETMTFTPDENTAPVIRVRLYMGAQGFERSSAWVWWEYRREGTAATADSGRIIRADHYIVDQNELIWVPVRLLRPGGVANMNYTVRYDARVVQIEGDLRAGNLLNGRGLFSGNPQRPLIRLGFADKTGFERDGTVAVIPFRAVGAPGSSTALDIEVAMVQNATGATLPIERIDGLVEIRDPRDPSGGDPNDAFDCDGRVGLNVADAQCALDMSVGLRPVRLSVDVDGDGQVTSADARQILQMALRGGR